MAAANDARYATEHAMTLRRTATALALLVVIAGVATALALGGGGPSKPGGRAGTAAAGAATVQRRDLVETDTEAGTLGYADPQTVYDRLSGTITWLPHVGEAIGPGGVLFAVDGDPVVLMAGTTPAYRGLAAGVGRGHDVLELNRNLVALGFDPDGIAVDDEWQPATTAGVQQLQRSLGQAETGKLALGRVVFLPGDQLVSAVDATLGAGGGGSGAGSPSSGATSDRGGAGAREYVSLQTPAPEPAARTGGGAPGTDGAASGRERALEAQLARLKAEVTQLKSDPGGGEGAPATTSPTAILQTTSTRLVVAVQLEASKQSEARNGEAVTVVLPDGETVRGTVTAVSAVAQTPTADTAGSTDGGQGSGAGSGGTASAIPVAISLHSRRLGAGLDQAAVSVNFVQAVARDVMSVPVTALLATGGASYAVQEAAPPHRLIAVTTGLFAAGEVQISGPQVRPGLRVSDSQG